MEARRQGTGTTSQLRYVDRDRWGILPYAKFIPGTIFDNGNYRPIYQGTEGYCHMHKMNMYARGITICTNSARGNWGNRHMLQKEKGGFCHIHQFCQVRIFV
jgi:hypothetical protein